MSSSGESSNAQVIHLLQPPALSVGASSESAESRDMLTSSSSSSSGVGGGAVVYPVGGMCHLPQGRVPLSSSHAHPPPPPPPPPQPDSASSSSSSASSSPQFTVEEQVTTVRIPMRRPNLDFLEIIHAVGGQGDAFTMQEIISHVKNYISRRQLFDHGDPRIVHCGNDPLGRVFGVDRFTIHEAVPLFIKHSYPSVDSCIRIRRQLVRKAITGDAVSAAFQDGGDMVSSTTGQCDTATQDGATASGWERRGEGRGAGSAGCTNPHTFPGSRDKEEGTHSGGQGTSVNIEYGDEVDGATPLFQLNMATSSQPSQLPASEAPEEDSVSVQYDSDHFAVEYEVESSDQRSESDNGPHAAAKDFVVVQKESDVEFWADYSETETSSDTELGQADQWQCESCSTLNIPFSRHCGKCWTLRPGWLPDTSLPTSSTSHLPPPPPGHPHHPYPHTYQYQSSNDDEQQTAGTSSQQSRLWCPGNRAKRRRIRIMSASSSDRSSESLLSLSDDDLPTTSQSQGERGREEAERERCRTCGSRTTLVSDLGVKVVNSSLGEGKEMVEGDEEDRSREMEGREEGTPERKEEEGVDDSGISSVPHTQDLVSSQEAPVGGGSCVIDQSATVPRTSAAKEAGVGGTRARGGGMRRGGDRCIMCDSRRKTGCIIHGGSGHQMCCYRCAKRLWREGLPCPLCRRPIDRVIKNFVL